MHESAPPTGLSYGSDPDQLAYKIPNAAKVLDMSERQVWALVQRGEIESFKIGNARRVTRQALLDYIRRQGEAA